MDDRLLTDRSSVHDRGFFLRPDGVILQDPFKYTESITFDLVDAVELDGLLWKRLPNYASRRPLHESLWLCGWLYNTSLVSLASEVGLKEVIFIVPHPTSTLLRIIHIQQVSLVSKVLKVPAKVLTKRRNGKLVSYWAFEEFSYDQSLLPIKHWDNLRRVRISFWELIRKILRSYKS